MNGTGGVTACKMREISSGQVKLAAQATNACNFAQMPIGTGEEGVMDQILAMRAFVPARDYALSKRFYQALGFSLTHEDAQVSFLKLGGFSFILQDFYKQELAENLMLQILVRDVDQWWTRVDAAKLVSDFAVRAPSAPSMQPWGMKVGFIFDPSGVLWHLAEAPF